MDAAAARFPAVPLARGHYESWYVKAADAGGRRAIWLRYTVHKRPGAQAVGSLWATLFDAEGPHAAKATPPPEALAAGGAGGGDAAHWVRVADGAIGPAGAAGEIAALASWELRFGDEGEAPFPYLPAAWMYRAPLPRTKAVSLRPAIRVSGEVTVRGRAVVLDGWRGMVGHNWGAEHAERWIWLHGSDFAERPDAWLDVVLGRIRVGRWTTPWVANGCLSFDGRRHRLGGIGRIRSTRVRELPERATFWLTGEDVALRGEVGAPPRDVVCWVYGDPAGPEHHTAHSSVADLHVRVARGGGAPPLELTVSGAAAYELGMREHDHGLTPQPFSDP